MRSGSFRASASGVSVGAQKSNWILYELRLVERLNAIHRTSRAGALVALLAMSAPSYAQQPVPEHTGLAAIVYTTAADFKALPRRQSTWVILAIGGAAAWATHPLDDSANERLAGSDTVGQIFAPGKWIGSAYVQAGTAVGLYVVGRYVLPRTQGLPRTNKVSHLGFDLLRAGLVSQAVTQGIKQTVRRDRPTGECCAFPSGHASTAFATASVIERHFGYRGALPTYLIATYVAASRLHDNRHFVSDVMFGAALGIASGWTVVGRHGRSDFTMLPGPGTRRRDADHHAQRPLIFTMQFA